MTQSEVLALRGRLCHDPQAKGLKRTRKEA